MKKFLVALPVTVWVIIGYVMVIVMLVWTKFFGRKGLSNVYRLRTTNR